MECRYCLEGGALLTPCLCRGTNGGVHEACLLNALDAAGAEGLMCRSCGHEFRGPAAVALGERMVAAANPEAVPRWTVYLADAYAETGDPARAAALLEALLSGLAGAARGPALLSLAALRPDAQQLLEEAAQLPGPAQALAQARLAELWLDQDKPRRARRLLAAALPQLPALSRAQASCRLAQAEAELGNPELAPAPPETRRAPAGCKRVTGRRVLLRSASRRRGGGLGYREKGLVLQSASRSCARAACIAVCKR